MEKEEKILTPEEKERKDRARFRILVVLIILDIALAAYLVYEMISVFASSGSTNTSQSAIAIPQILKLFK